MGKGAMSRCRKSGWGNSCISNVFELFPSDDPTLSSVVDLWGFYWGVLNYVSILFMMQMKNLGRIKFWELEPNKVTYGTTSLQLRGAK